MSPKKDTQIVAESGTNTGFTKAEKDAMKQRAKEVKTSARRGSRVDEAELESEVLAKISESSESDRAMAMRLHVVIKASVPSLAPRLWYGMPAFYKDGKLICFFQSAQNFKTRYTTFGFSDNANLDEGHFWLVAYALKNLTAAEEAKIVALVKKAVS